MATRKTAAAVRENDVPEEQAEVTTTADIMGRQEIVVDDIQQVIEPDREDGTVLIRVNRDIEDFTYGDPKRPVKLEMGKQYRMPTHIAQYLDGLGRGLALTHP